MSKRKPTRTKRSGNGSPGNEGFFLFLSLVYILAIGGGGLVLLLEAIVIIYKTFNQGPRL